MAKPLGFRQRWGNRIRSRSYEARIEAARILLGHDSVPPLSLRRRIGGIDPVTWSSVPAEFTAYLKLVAGLKTNSNVLEIGCGPGRMAAALVAEIGVAGSYDGFDLQQSYIDFCRSKFASRNPRFRFHVADIQNDLYNPNGTMRSTDYVFPAADADMDLVFATSVFSHTLDDVTAHYVREAARVLRPGGRMLFTCHILDFHSTERSAFTVQPWQDRDDVAVHDSGTTGWAVAYSERWIRESLAAAGLELVQLYPGRWSGTQVNPLSYQDVVLARC